MLVEFRITLIYPEPFFIFKLNFQFSLNSRGRVHGSRQLQTISPAWQDTDQTVCRLEILLSKNNENNEFLQQVQRQKNYQDQLELIRKEIEKENLKPIRLAPLTSMLYEFEPFF